MIRRTYTERIERLENLANDQYKRIDKLQDDVQDLTNSVNKLVVIMDKHRNNIDAHEV